MKHFSSLLLFFKKKQISAVSIYILIVICFISFPCSRFFFSNTASCQAKTVLSDSNESISSSRSIDTNILYQNNLSGHSTHYYCLYSQKDTGNYQITIKTKDIPSFSFQLFNPKGDIISPASYQYAPSKKILRIVYPFSSKTSYLLTLSNLSNTSTEYTIQYQKENAKKETKQTTNSKKTSSKPTQQTINSKKTSSKPTQQTTNSKKTSSKPIKQTTNSKKTSSKPTQITLSCTFLKLSKGKATDIRALITPAKAKYTCRWKIADSSKLSIVPTDRGQSIHMKAQKKGTTVVTCYLTDNKKISASCTIKID